MVFISSAKHLQLRAVSLLGCGSTPLLQDAAGMLITILDALLLLFLVNLTLPFCGLCSLI